MSSLTGQLGDSRGHFFGESDARVETGADGRAAGGQHVDVRQRRLDALDTEGDLLGVAAELLAQRQRSRVLHSRSKDTVTVTVLVVPLKRIEGTSQQACRT